MLGADVGCSCGKRQRSRGPFGATRSKFLIKPSMVSFVGLPIDLRRDDRIPGCGRNSYRKDHAKLVRAGDEHGRAVKLRHFVKEESRVDDVVRMPSSSNQVR